MPEENCLNLKPLVPLTQTVKISLRSSPQPPYLASKAEPVKETFDPLSNSSSISTLSGQVFDSEDAAQSSQLSDTSIFDGSFGSWNLKESADLYLSYSASSEEDTEGLRISRFSSSEDTFQKVSAELFQHAIKKLETSLKSWNPSEYDSAQYLQPAQSNSGQVYSVRQKSDGQLFAVKQMRKEWMQTGYDKFKTRHPAVLEQPWKAVALVKVLNDLKYPYACTLHGLFQDEYHIYVASGLASDGDLCSWCWNGPPPSLARERMIAPWVIQCCAAVRYLHDLNVAHLDLSLENVLLTKYFDEQRVKLIDFSQAQITRFVQAIKCGKRTYRAPELLGSNEIDAFKADSFSLGVLFYTLASQEYPWTAASDACRRFRFFRKYGLSVFAAYQRSKYVNGTALSISLVFMLSKLLELSPSKRMTLGEQCYSNLDASDRTSVWSMSWIALPIRGGTSLEV